jgi:hypothetical protein
MSRNLMFLTLLGVTAAMIAPPAGAGQSPGEGSTSRDRLIELFSGISAESDIQIATPSLFIEEAAFQGLRGPAVRLRRDGETVPVPLDDIRSVAVKRSHALQGSLWGGGAGILVGAVAGMMIGSFGCISEVGCTQTEKEGALRWGIAGGLLGTVTGYLFGRRSVYWHPIFP